MSEMIRILNGPWMLLTDPDNRGLEERWCEGDRDGKALAAPVPGLIHEVYPGYHGIVWYWHCFHSDMIVENGERLFVKFGAADYMVQVWLNGQLLGGHEGGETPFQLDVTNSIRLNEANLMAVRLLNPTTESIDGISLKQTPHRHKSNELLPGLVHNYAGIYYPVELIKTSVAWISDVFANPLTAADQIKLAISVNNYYSSELKGRLTVYVRSADSAIPVVSQAIDLAIKPLEHLHELVIPISQPRLWSLDDPHLYNIEVYLKTTIKDNIVKSSFHTRCGFRDFCVKNGYFRLNNKRIFLRAAHTGNHYPISWVVPQDQGLLRKDLVYAKACGFNMIRFISGAAHPVQLDFCDEMGLLVYEETNASWHYADSYKGDISEHLDDSPELQRRYRHSYNEMIKRDRNHPSVVIWGLLNETYDGPVFYYAKNYLKELRKLDDSRLVLLNSGRFDGQLSIGSVSNPRSYDWEYEWGGEAPGMPRAAKEWGQEVPAYVEHAGDIHAYPVQPQSSEDDQFIRTVGKNTKPVFLSEYGVASQADAIGSVRMYEQLGVRNDLAEVVLFRAIAESYLKDMDKYQMNDIYAFPEDMIVDSQRFQARLRLKGLDQIRSNPKICGYNLTGLLDHAISGEGLWDYWRVWKPDTLDAISNGFAPLRWCLFSSQMHGYSSSKLRVEAVLANEDILKAGGYPVDFKIRGPQGTVWEKKTWLHIPEPDYGEECSLASYVLDEEIMLEGCATGEYEMSAVMQQGGKPAGGRLKFYITNPETLVSKGDSVTLWGIDTAITNWLRSTGLQCRDFELPALECREVILIGKPNVSFDQWEKLLGRIARGGTAIFLEPSVFQREEDTLGWLPLERKGKLNNFYDSVYHKDCVAKNHEIFAGLQAQGVMDWDYYGRIIPHHMFEVEEAPSDTAAAAFALGYLCTGGYASGLLFGGYSFGEGQFFINTFHILEQVNSHPAADRLLLNIIQYASRDLKKTISEDSEETSMLIHRVLHNGKATSANSGDSKDELLLESFTAKKHL
ncbi:hypothetical protein EHS13_04840 [Paenibacillus psychroresistens]|uniref:Uncharacterized protein n=1 Tax=Paenibacillus psychroresistens TaxID=1778678 RepID=A0A6B8RFS5_9BACL|nr:glycoside hydrolase family 2 TIM barrel-domain containing protein [Paenibacillus psychroresistens]QGQ94278.1 hypothetical protein EHS13_04840 [Paenibacillus psychroresistens]